jgi:hypothetical protein
MLKSKKKPLFEEKKEEKTSSKIIGNEAKLRKIFPNAILVKKESGKICIYSEDTKSGKAKLLAMDKESVDKAWKKALHSAM